jgi:hypothetical protein
LNGPVGTVAYPLKMSRTIASRSISMVNAWRTRRSAKWVGLPPRFWFQPMYM